ncbi:MAG: helix-turn-helix domain-containing protein [Lachnospiraceae bacterium]
MKFCPEKLIEVRTSLNITKAEAARRLNISAMAYGRYERGEREPSYQSVCYIAQIFNCNIDYLYGNSNQMECDYILVSQETPELYSLIEFTKKHKGIETQLLEYAKKISND